MSSFLELICVFCAQVHNPVDCTVYPTADARQSRLNELKRCYRCLKTGHIPPQCRDFTGCANCNGAINHHTALCERTLRAASDAEKCVFCRMHYDSTTCRTVSSFTSRRKLLFKKHRCFRCLKRHPSAGCQEGPKPCDHCGEDTHHNALCRQNPFLKEKKANYMASSRCRICRSPEHHQVICPQNPVIRSTSSSPVSPTSLHVSTSCSSPSSSSDSRYTPEPLIGTPPLIIVLPGSLAPTPFVSSDLANSLPPMTENPRYTRAREAFYSVPPNTSTFASSSGSSANLCTTVKPIGFERQLKTVKSDVSPL